MKGIDTLMENRLAEIASQDVRLMEGWAPYIKAVEAFKAKKGEKLSVYDKRNIARVCENALIDSGLRSRQSKLFETTYQDNISFLGIQLPVIAALLPSLCLNKIANVQAMDRRSGAVFYLNVKYGQNKGGVASGNVMMDAKTGHNSTLAGRRYASTRVQDEVVATGDGSDQTWSGNLAYVPVIAGSVIITDGVETFTDNGSGVLVSDASGGANGTINYTNGAYAVDFVAAPALADSITATYKYNYEKNASGVPEVNFAMDSTTITAEDFPLKAIYTLGSAIDLQKAHGLNLEDEMVKYLGGEVKFAVDHMGIDQIDVAADGDNAATSPGTYAADPSTYQEWVFKKYQFIDFIEEANVNILAKTLRAQCNFLVVGNNGARLIRQLKPNFVPAPGLETLSPTGPYELGTIDGRLVIHDPFIATNRVIFGHRGDNYFQAGFVFAPYIPLIATPTVLLANLQAQKGFLSSAGYLVVNPGMFTAGQISGL